ncbi:helix-turn-helix domain-containing protein [Dactylosporangium sp. CA-139066]|uniref:helix-turn-helix domain-containing protein n=1 Tax=Dactylosporangium sp. CA-139066 TaxID=3239930 RepID=UPI003D91F804
MGDKNEPKTPAGHYLEARMKQVGLQRKLDLALAADVSPSTITRLFSVATYRPDVGNVRKLAAALQVSPDELMAGMAGEAAAAPEPPALPPLAAELGRMLADDSPLSERSRQALAALVDRVMDGSRREMRGGPEADIAVVLTEGETERHMLVQVKDSPQPPVAPPFASLAWLASDGSPMEDDARQALRQLLASALRLGQQAMLLHDELYGPLDDGDLRRGGLAGRAQVPAPKRDATDVVSGRHATSG